MPQSDGVSKTGIGALVLGALALLLALVTLWEARGSRELQHQVADAQQKAAKAQTMANLDNTLVQMLARAAIDNNDPAIRALLERNGVQLKAGAPSAPAPGAIDVQ